MKVEHQSRSQQNCIRRLNKKVNQSLLPPPTLPLCQTSFSASRCNWNYRSEPLLSKANNRIKLWSRQRNLLQERRRRYYRRCKDGILNVKLVQLLSIEKGLLYQLNRRWDIAKNANLFTSSGKDYKLNLRLQSCNGLKICLKNSSRIVDRL